MKASHVKPNEQMIQPCDPDGCFVDGLGRLGPTPRSLRDATSKIDDEAVFSVLQFGAIVPPLSPWKDIERLRPGFAYKEGQADSAVPLKPREDVSTLDAEQQADAIEGLLDGLLRRHIGDRDDPVLLFSGGVDSGILASRLKTLGYENTLLINFSFGPDDPESAMAESMAGALGLRFERVLSNRRPCDCLEHPGKVYAQPFADQSTVPTSDLAHSVIERLAGERRLILDGTGADGAFGMVGKIALWQKLSRVPGLLKATASVFYDKTLWHRHGRAEYYSRLLRRSATMPLLSAVLAQNPLAGTLYWNGGERRVDGLLDDWVSAWAGTSTTSKVVAADLALTCANTFAQKAYPIFRSAGHEVFYPFLHNDSLTMALSSIPNWNMSEPKAPLKASLARQVPREMVYRPKSGFTDPRGSVFFDPEFVDHLRSACEPTAPISHLLKRKAVAKAADLLSRSKPLPPQTLNTLWAIVFTDRWYRTAAT
jgi:asparagine synthetase B (glutamine-hydrolysing)